MPNVEEERTVERKLEKLTLERMRSWAIEQKRKADLYYAWLDGRQLVTGPLGILWMKADNIRREAQAIIDTATEELTRLQSEGR